MKIKEIIIESDSKGVIIEGTEKINDNCDIDVIMEDGEIYTATAFTFENITYLSKKNANTGECLNGRYFWSKNMLLVSKIERQEIELLIDHLIQEGEFLSIFENLNPNKYVWVFNGANQRFAGGIFENIKTAEQWIASNKLTGTLTKYPLNTGTLDWAIKNDLVNMKPEKLEEKRTDPDFIGGFTSASMVHFHYENGEKE